MGAGPRSLCSQSAGDVSYIRCVSKKRAPFCFCYNFVIREQISAIFDNLVAKNICNQPLLTDLKNCQRITLGRELLRRYPAFAVDVDFIFFTDELVWKLVDNILNTWSDRVLLCFAFISSSVTNISVGFCCVMFRLCRQWLYLACFLLGLQLNTTHQYKIWNVCFVSNFFCYKLQYGQIFWRSVINTQSNRKKNNNDYQHYYAHTYYY